MTTSPEPGERRPAESRPDGAPGSGSSRTMLDRPPGDRYLPARAATLPRGPLGAVGAPLAVALGGILAFVLLGGVLTITAGLVILAGLIGWLIGLLVRPPVRAAIIAAGVVVAGLLAIWLFGRWEGGVLDPIAYLAEVQGIAVPLQVLVAAGLAAAASR